MGLPFVCGWVACGEGLKRRRIGYGRTGNKGKKTKNRRGRIEMNEARAMKQLAEVKESLDREISGLRNQSEPSNLQFRSLLSLATFRYSTSTSPARD